MSTYVMGSIRGRIGPEVTTLVMGPTLLGALRREVEDEAVKFSLREPAWVFGYQIIENQWMPKNVVFMVDKHHEVVGMLFLEPPDAE